MTKTFQVLLFLILMLASAHALKPSMLGLLRERKHELNSVKLSTQTTNGFEIRTYSQTVDHFNYGPESYATFQQRYAINFKYWGGANTSSPIFFRTGGYNLPSNLSYGFLSENAPRFKALLVFAEETSESCYETIKSSWFEIDKIAAQPNGLTTLSRMFNTCRPLIDADDLKNRLGDVWYVSAIYDNPSRNPVATLCHGIDGEPHGTSVLQRIIFGLKAAKENMSCFHVHQNDELVPVFDAFAWQRCTEMVMPSGIGNDSLFQPEPFDMKEYILSCQKQFHVTPRPHWITTQYGGHNIKQVLENFGSNIIFSNGLRDPWSTGGVLENISSNIVALVTTKGSHCLDLAGSKSTDPQWLVSQRNKEVKILESWIADYNARKMTQ